jgi:glycosyltransferase involved in cell wall biosynthesis
MTTVEARRPQPFAAGRADQISYAGDPLVSIILFVRNGAPQVRRCVESVLAQTYQNWEFVVQDGASTDETLEILRSYNDTRIRIVSKADAGPSEGFWRALLRANGEILATCLSDEELLPDAITEAVKVFKAHPHIGAVTGDAFQINLSGEVIGEYTGQTFNYVDYLMADYCPYWSSSFFSMRALRSTGLFSSRWSDSSIEFEIWCRLAAEYEIVYLPKKLSKYGIHAQQLSHDWPRVEVELQSRLDIMRKQIFTANGFFGDRAYLRDVCILRQYVNLFIHFVHIKRPENAGHIHRMVIEEGLLRQFEMWRRNVGLHSPVHPAIPGLEEPGVPVIADASAGVVVPATHQNLFLPAPPEAPTRIDPLIRIYQALLPYNLRRSISPSMKQRIKRAFRV